MKRTLSLIVALLLALTVVPFGGLASAEGNKAEPEARAVGGAAAATYDPRSGSSGEAPRGKGFELDGSYVSKSEPVGKPLPDLRNDYLCDREYEMLYPFFFDFHGSEVGDYWANSDWGWPFYLNIDKQWANFVADDPYYQEDPNMWGIFIDDNMQCSYIEGIYMYGMTQGIGMFEGDLDVHDFTSLETMIFLPHYMTSVDASGCTALQSIDIEWYDGINDHHIWNNDYFDSNYWLGWDPEHHMQFVDLTGCYSLREIVLPFNGLEHLYLDGAVTENLEVFNVSDNQITCELPDMSVAGNLQGFNIGGHNHFSGVLNLDSPVLETIITQYTYEMGLGYGANDNELTEINIENSIFGEKHFRAQNGYVEIYLMPETLETDEDLEVYAYPQYPGSEFIGWFDADGNMVSSEMNLNYLDVYAPYDLTAVFAEPEPYQFASGSGTEEDPYLIATAEQLNWFSRIVALGAQFEGEYVALANDIYLNGTDNWELWGSLDESGAMIRPTNSWTPIGQLGNTDLYVPFYGTFDGCGHTIYGLYLNKDDGTNMFDWGLFAELNKGATVKNLTLAESYINGTFRVGGIAAFVSWIPLSENTNYSYSEFCCHIINCHNYATVIGADIAGGILGMGQGDIINCSNHGRIGSNIDTMGSFFGGVCGLLQGLSDYYNSGFNSRLIDSYNTGAVSVSVNTAPQVGGLAGRTNNETEVVNCYNAGEVQSDCENVHALIGNSLGGSPILSGCYYLDACGAADDYGTALTDEEMRSEESYEGFDFEEVWIIDSLTGYPYAQLRSQYVEPPEAQPGDLDLDGSVTIADALLTMRYSMGLLQLSEAQLALADFNGDGLIDFADALLILRRAMGLI